MDESKFEIVDMDNYRGDGKQIFSYEMLVMKALQNCIESGNHEMREGWYNESTDQFGNTKKFYIEDTRKKFIESVKTAYNLLKRHFDEDAKNNTKELLDNLKDKKNELLNDQWKWYLNLPPTPKEYYRGRVVQGIFNMDLGWYKKYVDEELETYRKIFEELMELIKREDDFGGIEYEA